MMTIIINCYKSWNIRCWKINSEESCILWKYCIPSNQCILKIVSNISNKHACNNYIIRKVKYFPTSLTCTFWTFDCSFTLRFTSLPRNHIKKKWNKSVTMCHHHHLWPLCSGWLLCVYPCMDGSMRASLYCDLALLALINVVILQTCTTK